MKPDGTYTFSATKPGEYVYEVPVCEPNQTTGCRTETLTINVLDPNLNNPPIANTDIANTLVNTPVTLKTLTNDQVGTGGAQLNPASVQVLGTVANGTTTVLPNGDIRFTPANNFAGVVTYMYRVCDNSTPT
ncbi:MAG: Ig-like domain-containing protein, partial [bacterium]